MIRINGIPESRSLWPSQHERNISCRNIPDINPLLTHFVPFWIRPWTPNYYPESPRKICFVKSSAQNVAESGTGFEDLTDDPLYEYEDDDYREFEDENVLIDEKTVLRNFKRALKKLVTNVMKDVFNLVMNDFGIGEG